MGPSVGLSACMHLASYNGAGGAQQPEQLGGQCSVDPVGLSGEARWSEQVSSTKHRCLGEKLGLG